MPRLPALMLLLPLLALAAGAAASDASRVLLQAPAPALGPPAPGFTPAEESRAAAAGGARPTPNTMTFGAVVPLTGSYALEGLYMQLGYELWADRVNAQGGIPILDRAQRPVLAPSGEPVRFPVDLSLRNDNSSSAKHAELMAAMLAPPPSVDFVLGGHTSFGLWDGKNGTAAERLVFLCCTGPPPVYAQGLPFLFGIHTSSDLYTRQLLKAAAQEGAVESVSILYNRDVPFTNSTCAAAAGFAAQFGLRIAVQESYGAAQAADPAVFDAFALKAAAGGPSLVLGCTLVQDGYLLAEALVRHEVPSQDTFITVMPTTAAAVTKLGANTSRYLLSATQWHTGMGGLSSDLYRDNFFGTAAEYATEFEAYSKRRGTPTPTSYLGAGPSAAAYALQLAISNAFYDCDLGAGASDAQALLYGVGVISCRDGQNNGYQRVMIALRSLRAPSFFGPLAFDSHQRNVGREPGTTQILDREPGAPVFATNDMGQGLALALVLPSDASDAALVLPQPNRFRRPCPPGSTFNTSDEYAPCVLCAPGTFDDGRSATCERCDLQSFSDTEGSAACTPCPANSATLERGSKSITACTCLPGFYYAGTPGQACEPCPEGAQCLGGSRPPYPQPGYWTNTSSLQSIGEVYQCNPSRNCAGGPASACASNFGGGPSNGPLCYACQPGYFMAFGSCQPCLSSGAMVVVYISVLVLWFMVNTFVYRNVSFSDLAVNMFQLLSVVGTMNVTWPQSLQTFFGVAKLFAFEVDVLSPVCSTPSWGFRDNQLVQLMLPPAFAAIYFSVHLARLASWRLGDWRQGRRAAAAATEASRCSQDPSMASGDGKDARTASDDDAGTAMSAVAAKGASQRRMDVEESLDRAIAASMAVVSVSYVALASYSVNAFVCTDISGVSVLAADPSQPCSGSDYATILGLGITGTIVYVIGLPVYLACVMYRLYRTKTLEARRNMTRFGWMYEAYKIRWFYFALVDLVHRGAFIIFVAVLNDPAIEVLAAGTFTLAVLVAVNAARPYVADIFTVAHSLVLCLIIFTATCGLVFYNPLVADNTYDGLTTTVIVFICIVCSLFVVALPWELRNIVLRARARGACSRAARAAHRTAPRRHVLSAFQPRYLSRLVLRGSRFADARVGALELAALSDSMAEHVSPHGDTSALSLREIGVFWRRVLGAFPEVVDFLAVTDDETHASFVKFMKVLFSDFGSSAGPHRISSMIVPQQHAAFAHWLATADGDELKVFNRVVALMLGAAAGDAGHGIHLERVRTFGRAGSAQLGPSAFERHASLGHASCTSGGQDGPGPSPFVRQPSIGGRSMRSALSAEEGAELGAAQPAEAAQHAEQAARLSSHPVGP